MEGWEDGMMMAFFRRIEMIVARMIGNFDGGWRAMVVNMLYC